TASRSSRYTAQWSAVAPSVCGTFTSAFCRRSARNAALSDFMTASATSLRPAAIEEVAAKTTRIVGVISLNRMTAYLPKNDLWTKCTSRAERESIRFTTRSTVSSRSASGRGPLPPGKGGRRPGEGSDRKSWDRQLEIHLNNLDSEII